MNNMDGIKLFAYIACLVVSSYGLSSLLLFAVRDWKHTLANKGK
jgi:hypothetical protein